ncbi:MAG TPA: GspH/FimT family pseudopilin [Candidatus Aminicenantes bacterium]|nr:GspH/FimT family pseudopilin [Candidatus Aminicenantes bacterium]
MAGRRPGFTLVEAVTALAISGLLVLGGAQAVGRLGPRLRLRSGAWEVTSGLGQARFQAVMSGEPVRVRFLPSGFVLERYDAAASAWRTARRSVLEGVAVRANNAPVFHPQGTVSNMATVTVSNSRGSYRITVAITGRIKTTRVG